MRTAIEINPHAKELLTFKTEWQVSPDESIELNSVDGQTPLRAGDELCVTICALLLQYLRLCFSH